MCTSSRGRAVLDWELGKGSLLCLDFTQGSQMLLDAAASLNCSAVTLIPVTMLGSLAMLS
eukprot:1156025-Pelagomonas_calceolata.AAC.1